MMQVPQYGWDGLVDAHDLRLRSALRNGAMAFAKRHGEGVVERILAHLRGGRARLRPFADAVQDAHVLPLAHVERRDVPLAAVRGSVGRATDFTPSLRPVRRDDEERWSGVRAAVLGEGGLPPVELLEYEGDYYVVDGHHRLSVLRDLGARTAEALVRRVIHLPTGAA